MCAALHTSVDVTFMGIHAVESGSRALHSTPKTESAAGAAVEQAWTEPRTEAVVQQVEENAAVAAVLQPTQLSERTNLGCWPGLPPTLMLRSGTPSLPMSFK